MVLEVFSIDNDEVIQSQFLTCKSNYSFALGNVVPLIQKLEVQRKIQNMKFYHRLGEDICKGCIMPPLTLAFIKEFDSDVILDISTAQDFIKQHIKDAFVLDGIQRLNTLRNVSDKPSFNSSRPIFFNVLICPSHDKLLYRMITLNNGQKPMTARHQIEALLKNTFTFNNDEINILSEKEAVGGNARGSFKKASFISAYLAFLSNEIDVDNKKIIDSKLDELLATKVIESGAQGTNVEFASVIDFIARFSARDKKIKSWFQNENNLIGFAVAMRTSFEVVSGMSSEDIADSIDLFDLAFADYDASKIRVSTARRKCARAFFENLLQIREASMEPTEIAMFLDK